MPEIKTVAVIGAGPAGLVAAREATAGGFSVTLFEQRHQAGGTWNYSPEPRDESGIETSAMYRSVTANASRPFLEYSDFPIPDTVPVYPRHRHIADYLRSYSDAFGITGTIRFGHQVLSVAQEHGDRWTVRWQHQGAESSETFDAVAVANGHHSTPRWPNDVQGLEAFAGPIIHSRAYKTPSNPIDTADKRVLIVGIGNSGCDISTDLKDTAAQVFLSTRSGGWVFPRWLKGRPVDQVEFESRFSRFTQPERLAQLWAPITSRRIKKRFFGLDAGVHRWGLDPQFGPYESHAPINDEFLPCIANGSVVVKPGLTELTQTGARFADGTAEEIDVAIFATGYSIAFPFLSPDLIRVDPATNRVELFQQMIAPDLPDTVAFLGVLQPQSGFMPVIEMQARWITALWQGRISLPSKPQMRAAIAKDRQQRERNYVLRPRHSIEVETPGYTDLLARQLGVMPKPLRHLRLLRQLLFEPIHPAQYRLDGPGSRPDIAERTLLNLAHNRRKECFNKSLPSK